MLTGMGVMNSFHAVLRHRAARQPDREAFTFLEDGEAETARCTYAELDQRARRIAARLQESEGSVLLLYPPGREFVEALFGCFYAGRVAIPVFPPDPMNLHRTLPRLQHIVRDARPGSVATTAVIQDAMSGLPEPLSELSALPWLATDALSTGEEAWREPERSGDALAFLQYTSGSTRSPRGVMLTHRNLLQNSEFIAAAFEHSPASRGVIWLPPYHDMGLIGGILQPVFAGFPCALMSPLDFLQRPLRWLRAISRYRGTTSGGPNFAYELCVRKLRPRDCEGLDLSSWDVAFNGAEPIQEATLERFTAAFEPYGFRREAFFPCYGLAEGTLAVTCTRKARPPTIGRFDPDALSRGRLVPASPGAGQVSPLVGCGRPADDHRCLIVDPETRVRCPPGAVGELWVSGPGVAQGYWNHPDESLHTFQARLADTGEGPFLRTGDLGSIVDGELYVTGRLKDVLIIRGRNYYPQDIEATVSACHAALRPNCAVAFTLPAQGEEQLVIVQEVKRAAAEDATDVILAIRRAVSQHNQLQARSVVLIPPRSLPKTSSGKLQRRLCRSLFMEGRLETVALWRLEPPGVQ
jgi:acyl-CoA synthetase (AMP-forming)/AMP-acid ligase II